ncbi:uncharacterized protein [Periplaneta americana]|uniref:uncharacterized protein n=1 Tax=Periplaneta americana TaxID=6978 RepID=UPI0037E9B76C
MLFYPSRRSSSTPRPLATGTAGPGDAVHLTWMLKSFVMGITLLGLSYWLVQIAGVQYLASLTSFTLLAFLLGYVVWCLLHKNRHSSAAAQDATATANRAETGTSLPLSPTPPPPFDQHQAYKFMEVAPRDCTPPPSYDEALLAMANLPTIPPGLMPRHYSPFATPPRPPSPHPPAPPVDEVS